jgi:hypothetical protein
MGLTPLEGGYLPLTAIMDKRPHYQNAPTFYQNALTFYQNAPLFSKINYNKKKKIM